jgi:membrane protein implicated in regulation of membrane protease activity
MKKIKKACPVGNCDRGPGHFLMMLSVTTLIVSGMVSVFKLEMYLAGTQWMLVSILLALYANIFFLTNSEGNKK